ncbi:MAG: serine/threonine-protein kinase, partial [Myxococcota bacterium]
MNDPNDPNSRDERPTAAIRPSGGSTTPGRVKDVSRGLLQLDTPEERYQRRKLLGRGGIGEVHLCHDRHIGRDVAMKLLRPATEETSFSSATVRFVREARVQGQLEHPAIVPVYELGVTPDGVEYFTMKRIGGQTLESILHGLRTGDSALRRAFPRNKLLQIFRQVCLAVEYAHVRGVVHRDLKPANIMVGHYGEVYVLDWGIAKVMPGEGSTIHPGVPEERTLDGQILGTVGYMPPEQLVGDARLDARADVYALGSILFEILTLQPLHLGASSAELMRSTQLGANARATERAPDRDVPPELERLCVDATHLQPDRRLD